MTPLETLVFTRYVGQQLRSTAGLVGRAGVLAMPDLWLYGLGGVTFGHFAFSQGNLFFRDRHERWARDVVDAACATDEREEADGEVVWSRDLDADLKSLRS